MHFVCPSHILTYVLFFPPLFAIWLAALSPFQTSLFSLWSACMKWGWLLSFPFPVWKWSPSFSSDGTNTVRHINTLTCPTFPHLAFHFCAMAFTVSLLWYRYIFAVLCLDMAVVISINIICHCPQIHMVERVKGETLERQPLSKHMIICWSDLFSLSPTLMPCWLQLWKQ